MRTVIALVVIAVAVLTASTATAQSFPFPKSSGAFVPVPPQTKPEISSAVQMRDKAKEQALRKLQSTIVGEAPTAVCGMTVIPAIPDVDPKSIKKAPTERKYTLRFVPPPMCGSSASTVVVPPPTVAPR
jgi:hypothetical protein